MVLSLLLVAAAVLAGCGGSKVSTTIVVRATRRPCGSNPQRVYKVLSGSMEPTYGIGARVPVSRNASERGCGRGLPPPEGAEQEECGPTPHVIKLGGAACAEPGLRGNGA